MEIHPFSARTKISDKDGNISEEFSLYLSSIVQLLQANLSNDGYTVPQRDKAEILSHLNTANFKGNLLYGSDDELVVNINGTFRKITTTPYV